jgi:uncharacterized membrane protein YphA (DoxX/SURF4 family)
MATTVALPRLARIACLWGIFVLVQSGTEAPTLAWTSVTVVAGVGVSILLLSAEDTPWSSVLTAAVLLATSPILQTSWMMPRNQPAAESFTFLKTMLILGGLLLLARLEAGVTENRGPGAP